MVDSAVPRAATVRSDAVLRLLPPVTRLNLRGGHAAMLAAGAVFGVAIPLSACRAAVAIDRAALWLGPDEQLLIAPAPDQEQLTVALEHMLRPYDHSLVNISHRQCAFELEGPAVATLLNSACPLDLDVTQFPPGMCTRTVFARAEIVLWRTAESRFRVEVWRSFSGYVSGLLAAAMNDGAFADERPDPEDSPSFSETGKTMFRLEKPLPRR